MPNKVNSLSDEQQKVYLENTYNVNRVELFEEIQHFCPLGEQIGITTYEICVVPDKHLAELVQLHWDIQGLMGKTFKLESGADMVLQLVKKAYQDAQYISVEASCGKNRHMPAKVLVKYSREDI